MNTHFRAKSNGIWVYGDFYNNCDRGVNQNFIVSDNEEAGTGDHIVIDIDTLSICTGVKDKNGNFIYEGDFLFEEFKNDNGELYRSYYPVVYSIESAAFCVDNSYYKDHTNLVPFISYFGDDLEVDGNIYDNSNRLPQENNDNSQLDDIEDEELPLL